MDQICPLDRELLERLERRLRSDDALPARRVSAGLTREALDALIGPLKMRLPREAILWWTWRAWSAGRILPGLQYVSLDAALDECRERLEYAQEYESPEVPASDWWSSDWLPVLALDGGMLLAFDLARSNGSVAPIIEIDWQAIAQPDYAVTRASSLGALVTRFLDALDEGTYRYVPEIGDWLDVEQLAAYRRRNPS